MTEQRCYYRPGDSRAIIGRHADDCDDGDCRGCLRCPEDHCPRCYVTHCVGTCPGCLYKGKTNLADIVDRIHELPAEALYGKAATSPLPGGQATVALGPRSSGAAAFASDDPEDWPRDDDWHPLDVLETWSVMWWSWFGTPEPTQRLTAADYAEYLTSVLHLAAATQPTVDEWPPDVPDMLRDIEKLKARLEDVTHAGDRPQRSQVPCLDCGERLEHRYSNPDGTEPENDNPDNDRWVCPRCRRTYTDAEYRLAKAEHLGTAEHFVPIATAAAAAGRSDWTIRDWVRRGLVAAACDPRTRLLVVWWPHVHAEHRTRAVRDTLRRMRRSA